MVAAGATSAKIAEALPDRTESAVRAYRDRIGVQSPSYTKPEPWTEDEKKTLAKMVGEGATLAKISEALPGRTKSALKDKRKKLKKSGAENHIQEPSSFTKLK